LILEEYTIVKDGRLIVGLGTGVELILNDINNLFGAQWDDQKHTIVKDLKK